MTGDDGLERYRVISTLGAGGMAKVLLAQDLRLGRKVALKRLAGDTAAGRPQDRQESNSTLLSRLRREALLGASISHANLVSIYDIVSLEDGDLVIVMEYVAGETLRDRMAREGRLPADEALPILEGIAAGLDAIHRRGIVHRDLKPANVLLGDDGTVKLADFGIATGAESTRITSQGAVVGTFRYMAPEQLEDAPSAPAMDIYALSVVALEMLSGERARPESNPIALAHALATQPPPDLRAAWPEAPAPVAELLMRGMSRDPSQRPRRASELVGRLRAALEDETRTAAGAPLVKRPSPGPAMRPVPRRVARDAALAAAATPRAERPRQDAAGRRESRWRFAAPIALVGVIAAGVIAVVLTTGGPSGAGSGGSGTGSGRSPAASSTHRGTRTGRSRKNSSSASTTSSTPARSSSSTAAGTSSVPSASSSGGTNTSSAGDTGTTPASSAGSGSPVASTPVTAVESFYHLAAGHQYAKAWALADSNFQQQLGGYQSFEAGQAADRSITFNKASVTDQTASSATVAVQTTSRRTDGTQSCSGDVDLVKRGASWQLDQIGINCS